MGPVNDEEMAVVRALRQSFESDAGTSGAAVNSHPNPFFLTLSGSFDMLKVATRVIAQFDAYRTAVAARQKKEAEELAKKLASAPADSDPA